jgi:hypothetical protein
MDTKAEKEPAIDIVIGPVLARDGGYAFDSWTPDRGLRSGYIYRRVEEAHYARKVEARSCYREYGGRPLADCRTADEFFRLTS